MTTEQILIDRTNGITTVTLNRPEKRNALHGELIKVLVTTLTQLANEEVTRVVLLRGAGEHFCAGGDIQWMQEMSAKSYDDNYDDALWLATLMRTLYEFPKPTIALVHGAAMGGGLGLIAACDMAIADKSATFAFSEVKLGIAPSTISPYVIAAIGQRLANYYFLTGERFSAEEAERMGLVRRVVQGDLTESATNIAKQLLDYSQHALSSIKTLIREVADKPITQELSKLTAEHLAHARMSEDGQEGLRAFIEKRTPVWR